MDENHRGRHTTVVFYCEACGNTRRGTPSAIDRVVLGDGSIDDEFAFCFLCVIGATPWERRRRGLDGVIW